MLDSLQREINVLGTGESNKLFDIEDGDQMFPETSQSIGEEEDSLMQLINEKAAIEDQGEALEDFAEENNINRGKFLNQ